MSSTQAKTGVEVERLPELPPLPPARNVNCGVDLYIGLDIHEYAKAYATAALAAERAEAVRMRERYEALLNKIDDAWANYERMGEVCPFEGQPMIYAATLEEIHEARAALSPSQGAGRDA